MGVIVGMGLKLHRGYDVEQFRQDVTNMPSVAPHRLTARTVASLRDGVFGDGGNLWLTVKGNYRAWSFRFKSPVTGKNRELGLGPLSAVTLARARQLAAEARQAVADGIDPIELKHQKRADRRKERGLTFEEVATCYIEEQAPGWRDGRSAPIWSSSLERLAYPTIGRKQVAAVDTDDVLNILRPIWTTKTETADRLRGRLERILGYAKTHGWRDGENPAQWRGHLQNILPKPSSVSKVEHHAAVNRKDIVKVMAALSEAGGLAAKAVIFTCLTAARSGEARKAVWSEFDLGAKLWIVPAERMKGKKEHRVPLSAGVLAILKDAQALRDRKHSDFVFPGQKKGCPLTDVALSKALHQAAGTKDVTVHGLRSTFRDWAAEETDYPREVPEMALAHAIGDKVEAAYRRGDLFEKRREMMERWWQYTQTISGK